MVLIQAPILETSQQPELTINNVQYWSKHTKQLAHSQVSKALKFVAHNCIQYINFDIEHNTKQTFICLPLNTATEWIVDGNIYNKEPYTDDYNSSCYKIHKDNGVFECDCQGWQTRNRREAIQDDEAGCCHTLALYYAFKLKRFRQ